MRAFFVDAGYVFSYGQVSLGCGTSAPFLTRFMEQILAMFTMVQPVLQTSTLIYDRWQDILQALKRSPRTFHDGCIFLATGERNPWKPIQEEYFALDAHADTTLPPSMGKPALSRSDTTSTLVAMKGQWQKLPDKDPDDWPPVRGEYISLDTAADTATTTSPPTAGQPELPRSDTTSNFVVTEHWSQKLPDEDQDARTPARGEYIIALDTAADMTVTTLPPGPGKLELPSFESMSTVLATKDQWQDLKSPDEDPATWQPVREEYIALDTRTAADTTITTSPSTAGQPELPHSDSL
jgi:hypothetical protein